MASRYGAPPLGGGTPTTEVTYQNFERRTVPPAKLKPELLTTEYCGAPPGGDTQILAAKSCSRKLLGVGQSEGETRLFAVRRRTMDDAGFGGFVERRRDALQSFGSFLFLAGPEKLQVGAFKGVKAGFDAAVV